MNLMKTLAILAHDTETQGDTALMFGLDKKAARLLQISEAADTLALLLAESAMADGLVVEEVQ